jgi:hypothetical protein
MNEPLNSDQITHRARNVAQVIMGYISTDTDGGETIHSDDLALALRECADTGLLPAGADGVLVWETARGMIPASVAVEGLSPEDHPAAQRSAEPTFPGEDFPEPADGEGARVAREEAAWERQIKAAPLPAAAPAVRWSVPEWVTRSYPVGSVWTIKRADGAAFGLITEGGADVRVVIKDHIVIAQYGEPFVIRSHLLADVGGAPVAFDTGAFAWIATRVDA